MTGWKSLRNVSNVQRLLRSAWRAALYFALACVTLAAAVRLTTGLFSADVLSFATFYPATLIVALVGGLWLGVLAAAGNDYVQNSQDDLSEWKNRIEVVAERRQHSAHNERHHKKKSQCCD
jgi:hypothetical protein